MKRLYDRNAPLLARVIGARRYQGKRVVEVSETWPLISYESLDFSAAITRPECADWKIGLLERIIASNLVIVTGVGDHMVSSPKQHIFLVLKDDVLSARLQVAVMYQENFHPLSFRFNMINVAQQSGAISLRSEHFTFAPFH